MVLQQDEEPSQTAAAYRSWPQNSAGQILKGAGRVVWTGVSPEPVSDDQRRHLWVGHSGQRPRGSHHALGQRRKVQLHFSRVVSVAFFR